MTSPADQNINAHMGGVDPVTGDILTYQFNAECLGRVTYSSNDHAGPYTSEFTQGDPVVGSAATYDQVKSINQMQGARHVDPFGNVVNPKKVWLIQWYWMLDGCPTPLTRTRMLAYIKWADELRPWPTAFVASFAKGYTLPASEGPPMDYSTVNPLATLDSFT
jgi:hypothetical protein